MRLQATTAILIFVGATYLATGGPAEAHEAHYAGGAPLSSPLPATASVSALALYKPAMSPLQQRRGYGDDSRVKRRRWHEPDRDEGRSYGPRSWLTLRGGVFDSEDVREDDYLVGIKATGRIGPGFWAGVSTDLQRRTQSEQIRLESFIDASGNEVTATATIFASSSNLFPVMAVLEYEIPTPGLRPYVGVGAGYEVLVTYVDDFEAGLTSTDTFGGFGWQGYAGLAIPITRRGE